MLQNNDTKTLRLIMKNFNLIIENLEAKIITIKTKYTIMQQFLSAERLIEEIQNVSLKFLILFLFRHHLNIQDAKTQNSQKIIHLS